MSGVRIGVDTGGFAPADVTSVAYGEEIVSLDEAGVRAQALWFKGRGSNDVAEVVWRG